MQKPLVFSMTISCMILKQVILKNESMYRVFQKLEALYRKLCTTDGVQF